MPKIVVKFFQDFRELTGVSSMEMNVDQPMSLLTLLNILSEHYQKLKPVLEDFERKGSAIILVNGRTPIDASSALIKGGEEIAILPMMEGG
ncbi:MAG: MoaD/ThiS family protein [Candidatus Methanomethyliaceae archaeon]|nr:MoaD/ThiS family protein [Candidatus Methanomethyliaceae archaeon]MDW7970877.1 MoaD/ThiS family protein [Nitrososphaerota archaeon]